MKKDMEYDDLRSWGLRMYHRYVAQSMSQVFKWVRYERRRNTLTIFDLRNPGILSSITDRECADRYERWYLWMKSQNNPKSLHSEPDTREGEWKFLV